MEDLRDRPLIRGRRGLPSAEHLGRYVRLLVLGEAAEARPSPDQIRQLHLQTAVSGDHQHITRLDVAMVRSAHVQPHHHRGQLLHDAEEVRERGRVVEDRPRFGGTEGIDVEVARLQVLGGEAKEAVLGTSGGSHDRSQVRMVEASVLRERVRETLEGPLDRAPELERGGLDQLEDRVLDPVDAGGPPDHASRTFTEPEREPVLADDVADVQSAATLPCPVRLLASRGGPEGLRGRGGGWARRRGARAR